MKPVYWLIGGVVLLVLLSRRRQAAPLPTYHAPTTAQSVVKGFTDIAGAALGKFFSSPSSPGSSSSAAYHPDQSFDDYTAALFGPGTDG